MYKIKIFIIKYMTGTNHNDTGIFGEQRVFWEFMQIHKQDSDQP